MHEPARPALSGYKEAHAFAVPSLGRGARLELLEDERLDSTTRRSVDSLYAIGGRPCVDPPPANLAALCASVARAPLRAAIVRLVGVAHREGGLLTLERATAELSRLAVSLHDSVFSVRVDLSADMGSYNGPVVRLLDVGHGRLAWTRVIDDATHRTSELDLPLTLKTGWQADTDAPRPEIFLVACRPDLEPPATKDSEEVRFTLTYSRYYLADGRWHRVDRRVPGCWEDDNPFPPRSAFP